MSIKVSNLIGRLKALSAIKSTPVMAQKSTPTFAKDIYEFAESPERQKMMDIRKKKKGLQSFDPWKEFGIVLGPEFGSTGRVSTASDIRSQDLLAALNAGKKQKHEIINSKIATNIILSSIKNNTPLDVFFMKMSELGINPKESREYLKFVAKLNK